MLTDNTILVFVIAGALALLSVVQLILAVRYDRVIIAAGPIEELAVYDRRIAEKRRRMDDLEEELDKRRQAMAVAADLGAEVDGLRRQKEELLAEWESLRERRDEVQVVRHEIEQAMVERQSLEAEIAPLRAEFLVVKERLERAEELVGRIDCLKREHEEVSEKIVALRDEMQRLEEAETRVQRLEMRGSDLETENKRLENRISTQESELGELSARVSQECEALAAAQTDHGRIATEIAAGTMERRRQL